MDLATFLALPRNEIAPLAPATVVWAPGGTRRQAVLAGMQIDSHYTAWGMAQQLEIGARFFGLGVQTLFMPILGPPQWREIGPYRERLVPWLVEAISRPESMAAYARMGVRVRCYGQQRLHELDAVWPQVEAATSANGPHTLWFSMAIEANDEPLADAMGAALAAGARTLPQAVQAFYGEQVAPVEVFIGFGKPMVGHLMPPLLGEFADLYWMENPSYTVTESQIRQIFWDHRFARSTWQADKAERYTQLDAPRLRQLYQQPLTLGVGTKIGPFWYPASTAAPETDEEVE